MLATSFSFLSFLFYSCSFLLALFLRFLCFFFSFSIPLLGSRFVFGDEWEGFFRGRKLRVILLFSKKGISLLYSWSVDVFSFFFLLLSFFQEKNVPFSASLSLWVHLL